MPLHNAVANLTKSYYYTQNNDPWVSTEIVSHRGTLIAIAQTQSGLFFHTILNPNAAQTEGARDADGWSANPRPLQFPVESISAGAEAVSLREMPVFTSTGNDPRPGQFIRPEDRHPYKSTTAGLSEPGANFNVVSDGIYLCLFRQSRATADAPGTILMDRYNFDGKALTLKIETRYQRSRLKSLPRTQKDTLGFEDLNKNRFYEPTHRLDYFVNAVSGGYFAAVLVPSLIPDEQNWQFFTWEAGGARIHCVSIPRGKDGLFDERARTYYVSSDKTKHPDIFSAHPGDDPDGNPLIPWNGHGGKQAFSFRLPGDSPTCHGMHAVVYARQSTPALAEGETIGYSTIAKPVLGEQRLLLAIASRKTNAPEVKPHFVTLDFGVSRDGRLVNASREWLIAQEQAAPDQVFDMTNRDDQMDSLMATLEVFGSQEDVTANQATTNTLQDLHNQRTAKEQALTTLYASYPDLRSRWETRANATNEQSQLAAQQKVVSDLEAQKTAIEADYAARFSGKAHTVELFTDKNPDPDQAGDCTLTYNFPPLSQLYSDGTLIPVPNKICYLRDYDFNDTASAARINTDALTVEFYRHGKAGEDPTDKMFWVTDARTINRFTDALDGSNDELSAVIMRPKEDLYNLLVNYRSATSALTAARAERDRLAGHDAAIVELIREPGGQVAGLYAALADLDKQIIAAQASRGLMPDMLMPPLTRYYNQGSGIDGGITAFAWSEHPPRLVRNADGRVSLYFRGAADQFFVASYNVMVNPDDTWSTPAWLGSRPNMALALDHTALSPYYGWSMSAAQQLTLESWIRPRINRTAWLFTHSDYAIRLNAQTDDKPLGLQVNIHGRQGEIAAAVPLDTWTHVALVFRRASALRFTGNDYVDCGKDKTLDIVRDLTIEVALTPDGGGGSTQTVLYKGEPDSDALACAMVIGPDMGVRWRYAVSVTGGATAIVETDTLIRLQPGVPTRIAVVREYVVDQTKLNAELDRKKQNPAYEMDMRVAAFVHRFYQEGVQKHTTRSDDQTPTGGDGAFVLGANASLEQGFSGAIADVRVWNKALEVSALHQEITRAKPGLVSWWRMEEGAGYTAEDAKSGNHGTIVGAQWVNDPDERASTLSVYLNGRRVLPTRPVVPFERWTQDMMIGGWSGSGNIFSGEMEAIRIWSRARTAEQIQDNLFRDLDGENDGLLACYDGTIESYAAEGDTIYLADQSGNGYRIPTTAAQLTRSTAPIGLDAPLMRRARGGIDTPFTALLQSSAAAAEYGDMQTDAEGGDVGVLKRAYAFISEGRWNLFTGFKVGDLELEWIGQAQFDPQVIGFIEGAPPVPSENLTFDEMGNYDGMSKVTMQEAESTVYAIGSSSEKTSHMAIDMMMGVGVESESEVGLGAATTVEKLEIAAGVRMSHESTTTTSSETEIGFGRNLVHMSAMSLTGYWETTDTAQFPAIGRRYVPQNVGYAVVQSETVDIFALRMKTTGLMVSRTIRKNPDIPRDWNIIMFPINPRYTKQGSLDGKVGLEHDPDYPASMSYSPDSSYFKPIEAYRLKRIIEQQAQVEREKYVQFGVQAAGGLPQVHKRDIVNTYVWTADGGLFAESTETIDTMQQVSAGSFSWDMSVGVSAEFKVIMGKAGPVGSFELMAGGGVTTSVMKSSESETGFSVEVELDLEPDIYERDAQESVILVNGAPKKLAGKVDAYRFMTFYLSPDNTHLLELKNRIVDPAWLASDDLNAAALKSALASAEARPWRILHRVTFISRVHETPGTASAQSDSNVTASETMINSNYELIQALRPHIVGRSLTYAGFEQQVRQAVNDYLPLYAAKVDDIVRLMGAYYEMFPVEGATDPVYAAGGNAGATAPVPSAPAASAPPDEIIVIHGIGERYQAILHAAGITTFAQLANLTAAQVADVIRKADSVPPSADRIQGWITQAIALMMKPTT